MKRSGIHAKFTAPENVPHKTETSLCFILEYIKDATAIDSSECLAVVNHCQKKLHFKFCTVFSFHPKHHLKIIENKPRIRKISNFTRANQKVVLFVNYV